MTLNLHGVVRAAHPGPAEGALQRFVTWQDLAAVVSEVPAGRALNDQDALAHLKMLSGLVREGPVVPLRFGTTAVDEDAVRSEVLGPAAPRLRGHLNRLDGLVEVHVYLRFEEEAALRAVFEENKERPQFAIGGDLSRRIQIGEQIAQRVVAWRRAQADALLAVVSTVARNEVYIEDREPTEERRAFLVSQGELDTVRTAVARLDGMVDAEFVGPLPAYNFLTESAVQQDAAPASRWGW